ncbi:MAG: DUF2628 domain-containing protein, partial [Legionellales bacterium]|nr:DUF2628 domain-containing protein [Legionellales bacterium]
ANTWNWGAFCFSFLWLAYRKMYGYFTVFLIFALLLLFIALAFNFNAEFIACMIFLPMAILGYFGNQLYRHHVDNKFLEIYATTEEHDVPAKLIQVGGVSFYHVIISIFIISTAMYFLFVLFNAVPADYRPLNLIQLLFSF